MAAGSSRRTYFPVEIRGGCRARIRFTRTPEPAGFRVERRHGHRGAVPPRGATPSGTAPRRELAGRSVAYERPPASRPQGRQRWIRRCSRSVASVGLLIHDARYDIAESAQRPDWGHCTAVGRARRGGGCGRGAHASPRSITTRPRRPPRRRVAWPRPAASQRTSAASLLRSPQPTRGSPRPRRLGRALARSVSRRSSGCPGGVPGTTGQESVGCRR